MSGDEMLDGVNCAYSSQNIGVGRANIILELYRSQCGHSRSYSSHKNIFEARGLECARVQIPVQKLSGFITHQIMVS